MITAFEYEQTSADVAITPVAENESGISLYCIKVDYPAKQVPLRIRIIFYTEFDDVFGCWTPQGRFRHELMASWRPVDTQSRSASGAPVFSLYAKNGENRCTFALSDAANSLRLTAGVEEQTGKIQCTVELFTGLADTLEHYEVILRINKSRHPYYESLEDVRKWWSEIGYVPARVPADARCAMFSSWYNFQKNIKEDTVFEQCLMAKNYGLDTLILDDGWQCDEVQNGYEYCGDWEAAVSKFKDMRHFVDRLHNIKMKCILWYSVPFIGIHAKNIKRFEGKYLRAKDKNRTVFILDPRYLAVRNWLVKTYETAVRTWDLDGLKLDFIDSFSLAAESSPVTDEMDCPSLEAAVESLFCEITASLTRIKPDIMLEFRQSYVGPVMQKYGNIIRVGDCAGGALINRVSSIDLRLLTGDGSGASTAVHSDMLMWDYKASPEGAADQLAACLFCTPQISMMLNRLPESHCKMLHYYLDFMTEYRDVLLMGKLMPLYPEANYAQVLAEKDGTVIAALYENPILNIPCNTTKLVVINATGSAGIYLVNPHANIIMGGITHNVTIKNCMGEILSEQKLSLSENVLYFDVPHNGFIEVIFNK